MFSSFSFVGNGSIADILLLPAGFNSTLRQGNITHHEYIQVAAVFFCLLFYQSNVNSLL